MHKVCKVAIVGAGFMAAEHVRAFSNLPGAELVGIVGRSPQRVAALAAACPGLICCGSIAELYRQTRADIVVVAVNELAAGEVARACFAYPWTVLLEKPAGIDLDEAGAILDAAQAAARPVYVGLNRRSYASTRAVASHLAQIEGPRFVKVQDQEDIIEARAQGRPERVIANWMFANAIHVVDYFRIFGRGEVVGVTPVVPWNPAAPGVVVAHIAFASGDTGLYEAIWNAPGPWAVSVNAGRRRYELRPLEQAAVQDYGERRLTPLPTDPIDQDYKAGLRHQAAQLVAAARGQPNELATLVDAFRSMQLVAQIYGLER